MSGIRFPKLANQAKEFWEWCEWRNLWVSVSYINNQDNWEADTESRRLPYEIEGELSVETFDLVTQTFGRPEIDLFASHKNAKCAKFVFWFPDPGAFAVDAFTLNWSEYFFYAFPPFSMILRAINKIILDKAEGILIVPLWDTQPWFPLLLHYRISSFLPLQDNHFNLFSRPKISLGAVKLSGKL